MKASEAREQTKLNRDRLHRERFGGLWDQLMDCVDSAVERGDFQVELETDSSEEILPEIVAKLKARKFDVTTEAISGSLWDLYGERKPPTFKVWVGWADDECDANKVKSLPPKSKPKPKPKRKRAPRSKIKAAVVKQASAL